MATRCAFNTIIPDLVYQRAQILTWPLEQKTRLLLANKIEWVVNFWTKIDPEMTDLCRNGGYLYLPLHSSFDVMKPHIQAAATFLHKRVDPDHRLLILCEAGKTRSVYFAALMLRLHYECTGREAIDRVIQLVPTEALKWEMKKELTAMEAP